jgi:protein-S-isoprenylcysteine O-methyltransferase Ste14
MTAEPQCSGSPKAAQDVAHLGFVRPPILYLTSIVTGALIQLAKPFPFLPRALAVPLGASVVVVAIALFSYAVGKFRAAGTSVPARKPTSVIVSTGPYRFSRNPIYLAGESSVPRRGHARRVAADAKETIADDLLH